MEERWSRVTGGRGQRDLQEVEPAQRTFVQLFAKLLGVFLQDGLLGVQHGHVHLQVRAAGLLRLQDVVELLHLERKAELRELRLWFSGNSGTSTTSTQTSRRSCEMSHHDAESWSRVSRTSADAAAKPS